MTAARDAGATVMLGHAEPGAVRTSLAHLRALGLLS
jgi:hypothetical protein